MTHAPEHHALREDIEMAEHKTHITDLRTVAVPVTDQDRALEFYVGALGFEKRLDETFGGGRRWIEVAPSGSSTSIALAPLPQEGTAGVDTGIRLVTEDADADHAELLALGVDTDPEVLHFEGAPPMFSLRDPDGNLLYVVELEQAA
jgi:catechol 2,3-dioxygenase-like lactoylglutathione lyase family enzyme